MTITNQCYLHATYEGVAQCQLILPNIVGGCLVTLFRLLVLLLLLLDAARGLACCTYPIISMALALNGMCIVNFVVVVVYLLLLTQVNS